MPLSIPTTLLQELIRTNIISEEQAAAIGETAKKENKDFGEVLVAQGLIGDTDLVAIKSRIYRLPAVNLEEVEFNRDVLKEMSEDVASFYRIIPLEKAGEVLKVGLINPEDVGALEALKFITSDKGLALDKYIVSYKDYASVLKSYRTLSDEVGQAIQSLNDEVAKEEVIAAPGQRLDDITAEAPVTRIVAVIIRHAVDSRASDIHIEAFEDRVRTRFRIDGVLNIALTLPKNLHSAILTRIKILADLKIDEARLAQDGRFATRLNDRKIDFRVSTFPTKHGEKVVMRILDPLTGKVDLPDLGLDGRSLEVMERGMSKPFGSILITGPTGSGKSTTLAGMLKRMNTEDINIVTLEDPIEYFVDGVNQSQIHEEIGYTFASGLRHAGRPDRPYCPLHPSHQRCDRCCAASDRYGHRTLPDSFDPQCRRGPAPIAPPVPGLQASIQSHDRRGEYHQYCDRGYAGRVPGTRGEKLYYLQAES